MNWRNSFHQWLQTQWYGDAEPGWLLSSLEQGFRRAVRLRRSAYHTGRKVVARLPVPVIVVGNLTVGGTGKTPLTLWLAEFLKSHGYRPGIVSRGYGGRPQRRPLAVGPDTPAAVAGDEPVLLARRGGCPVYVYPRRVEAARTLLAETDCNLVIADDGLQHYALGRDIEIAVVDGLRGFGNAHCLPAGPLREPPDRLHEVDLVVHAGSGPAGTTVMTLVGESADNLLDPTRRQPLAGFADGPVHALAGIGHPERFFEHLRRQGLAVVGRPFPDHHAFRREDLAFAGAEPLLMTEKDAVKCLQFATPNHWQVRVEARLPAAFGDTLINLLKTKAHGQEVA